MFPVQLEQVFVVPVVAEGKECQKDLMPLLLPCFTDVELLAAKAGEIHLFCSDVDEWDRRVWLVLVVHSLNSLYEVRDMRFRRLTPNGVGEGSSRLHNGRRRNCWKSSSCIS